jgi:hypothetical protein
LSDVTAAKMFANDRATFTLRQSVVIALSEAMFGKFSAKFFQQFRDVLTDEFGTVIGVKSLYF